MDLQSASEDEEAEELPRWDEQDEDEDEDDGEEEEAPEYEKPRVDTLLGDNVRVFGRKNNSLHPLMQKKIRTVPTTIQQLVHCP